MTGLQVDLLGHRGQGVGGGQQRRSIGRVGQRQRVDGGQRVDDGGQVLRQLGGAADDLLHQQAAARQLGAGRDAT